MLDHKLGADFVIKEETIDMCVDAAMETKRFWKLRRFFIKPGSQEIVNKGISRDSELIRNTQLIELAAIGLAAIGMSKTEIKLTLKLLLERGSVFVPDDFLRNQYNPIIVKKQKTLVH